MNIGQTVRIGDLTEYDVFEDRYGARYIHLGGYTINADNVDDKYITSDFRPEYVTYLGSLREHSLNDIWKRENNRLHKLQMIELNKKHTHETST